ncbi:unnamed protein product [Darwinula stevensoni]|uniref:UDP-glucose 6-dehydrogenase n=1 Tax=Darwinula stevensoni TaxID=69355 RepID=A0A7R8XDR3_9CRUS|nr:unnamed protein product [Darwinula stevensoni]CAG0888941.1 unnamed protein product [Darwinula stevensoni]
MTISIIGAGYVGLITAACLARVGHRILCVEKNPSRLAILEKGQSPIYEKGLDEVLSEVFSQGTLRFTSSIEEASEHSDVIFLCVGTPSLPNGDVDLSQVEDAAISIARCSQTTKIIVSKSTVPVGTAHHLSQLMRRHSPHDLEFTLASNPEFLKEGVALEDFMHPDRIVVGCDQNQWRTLFEEIYQSWIKEGFPLLFTDTISAELIKYASNSFLATKISFINMISDIAENAGGRISDIALGMGLDPRIGRLFLQAGLGYGGSCFPKDIKGLMQTARNFGVKTELLEAVEHINADRIKHILHRVQKALGSFLGKKICLWGLSFKEGTNDIRDAASLTLVSHLLEEGAILKVYDPQAMPDFMEIFPPSERLSYAQSAQDALLDADALLIVTAWQEFKDFSPHRIKESLRNPLVIDGRNCLHENQVHQAGLSYIKIGEKSPRSHS